MVVLPKGPTDPPLTVHPVQDGDPVDLFTVFLALRQVWAWQQQGKAA